MTMNDLQPLPDALLAHIGSYLSLADRCRWCGTGRRLWALELQVERRTTTLALTTAHHGDGTVDTTSLSDDTLLLSLLVQQPPHHRIVKNVSLHLHTLSLGPHATDDVLKGLTNCGFFQLRHLSLVQSLQVTDHGLESLSQGGAAGLPQLETIDLTHCRNTTYAGTFPIRDAFTLKVLRRQPAWLDGHFSTPFGSSGQEEIHTYHADGTFSFTRPHQSRGFVAQFDSQSKDYLTDKLQYTNVTFPAGWPAWARYAYRPGVCLLRLPVDDNDTGQELPQEQDDNNNKMPNNNNKTRTVLVGQCLKGLKPPRIEALMRQQAHQVPVGESHFFRRRRVDTGGDGAIHLTHAYVRLPGRPASHQMRGDAVVILSKMAVQPLLPNQVMPPRELVEECRAACTVMAELGQNVLDNGEAYLEATLTR